MGSEDSSSCEQLKKRIRELERLNRELLEEQRRETKLDYAWSGNLGHWYFDIESSSVIFNPLKVSVLGYEASDIPESVPYQFFTGKLHPDDYEPTMQAMRDHLSGKTPVYECSYRIQAKDGSYKWFYDRGRITQRDADGKPVFLAGIVFDITESKQRELSLEQSNAELRYDAVTDELTSLPNRRAVIGELRNRMHYSKAQQRPLSVCMLDIDHFKLINDEKGHVYGDYVLQQIASVLQNEVRGLDTVGRYGGEEFLAVFYDADREQAQHIAERIRQRVEQMELNDGVRATISGGIAMYDRQDLTGLVEEADKNLYAAKNRGRNRIVG